MIILGVVVFLGMVRATFPEISFSRGIDVKILYDFSGSMYPGYPEVSRYQSGVKFFYEYDDFRSWMTDFVKQQIRFSGKRVSLSLFRSQTNFSPGDVTEVHPMTEISRFNVNRAFSIIHPAGVDFSYLAESLDEITKNNFEGLVWLITDNRVETKDGAGTTRMFLETIKEYVKYRSVHIYKLPFEDSASGLRANLAVYGILVSPSEIPITVSNLYDKFFKDFNHYFSEGQYAKLKDLNVCPVDIEINPIEVDIDSQKKAFSEGGIVKLFLQGTIKSNLTHHTITGGTLIIRISKPFEPDDESKQKFGVQKILEGNFEAVELKLTEEIPPNGEAELSQFVIRSTKSISLTIPGIENFIKAATNSVKVKYSGTGEVSSNRIDVAIKKEGRQKITGIYKCEDFESVFKPQTSIKDIKANPSEFPLTFTLKDKGWRGFLFLLIFLLLLVPICLFIFLMMRRENYRIKTDKKNELVGLKRLGRYAVTQDGVFLGVLTRGMSNTDTFTPNTGLASLKVTPGKKDGEYNIAVDDKENKKFFQLTIEPVKSSRIIKQKSDSNLGSTPGQGTFPGDRPRSVPGSVTKPSSPGSKPKVTIRRP